ncbi:MAG: SDR family oxidoreductase [Hyphomicrobiales bacterium]|nr:MAG: SDR family oxidoreductase [Hyphomicrobiales bacterium]
MINASSAAGLRGTAGHHPVRGIKRGPVRIMSKDVAAKYGSKQVRVHTIHPLTSMAEYGATKADASLDDLGAKMAPLCRLTEVDDVAKVVVFHASDDSTYLTSGEYTVDGRGNQPNGLTHHENTGTSRIRALRHSPTDTPCD